MQPQRSFADVEYDGQKRQTRRAQFLRRMDGLIPWHRRPEASSMRQPATAAPRKLRAIAALHRETSNV